MPDRPNILLITSDQQRGDCYGFAGRKVKTPHLDALAAAGTRLDTCITPNGLCQPARASILTGLLPLTHGVADNGFDLPAEAGEAGFAGQLARQGYATGLIGKAHLATHNTFEPTGSPECEASQPSYGSGWRGPWMGFGHVELSILGAGHNLSKLHDPPQGQHYEARFARRGLGEAHRSAYSTRLPPSVDGERAWHSALPSAEHHTSWVADKSIRFMRGHQEGPFCLWASFSDPHFPFDCPDPWSRLHDPEEVDLPRVRERRLEGRPSWQLQLLSPDRKGQGLVGVGQPPPAEGELRRITANYYGMISLIDHNVGRMLKALEAYGLAENTLVFYTSDHGEWLGDHGLLLKGPLLYDGLLRVGCIVRGPGVPAGQVRTEPVSTVDLAATMLEAAQAPVPGPLHGQPLQPVWVGGASRDCALNEWDLTPYRIGFDLKLRTVRTTRHRLTVDLVSGDGELYDLYNDPGETENRFTGDAGLRKQMMELLQTRPEDRRAEPLPRVGLA